MWNGRLVLRHFKIQALLKTNCCMAVISAFLVAQHCQIFSLFFRNRIQCIALYQLHNSQALLNLRHGYYRNTKPKLLRTSLASSGRTKGSSIVFPSTDPVSKSLIPYGYCTNTRVLNRIWIHHNTSKWIIVHSRRSDTVEIFL